MSILSRLTYSLEVKLNIFLQAFEFERCIEDPELQVDALLETSAKMKTRNRAAIGHSIDTLQFMGQLGIPFGGYTFGRLQFNSMGNSELAVHLKESLNATYLSPDIQNELITRIGEEILPSSSSKVKYGS